MDFYYMPGTAPCRAVQMTAIAVGVELNLKLVNLMAGEHKTPEFLELNPQHCIPTLVDGGLTLWESHAICAYLADQYGKKDSFYPQDPKKRAAVNQRLYFDQGTLYQRFCDYYYPQFFGKQSANKDKYKKLQEAVGYLDKFLSCQKYVAGDSLTVADLNILATISTYDVVGFDLSQYRHVQVWYERIRDEAPGFALNQNGAKEFLKYV